MKDGNDVKRLKREWSKDPFWDLKNTPLFSEYYEELKEFQEEIEGIYEKEKKRKEAVKKKKLKVPL